jgi:hypothetical protein
LLLIALWVRSYWWADDLMLQLPNQQNFVIHSMQGSTAWYIASGISFHGFWTGESVESLTQGLSQPFGFVSHDIQILRRPVLLPHWLLTLLFAMLAGAPWLGWRFSLRTLLIGMTVVAVALGLIFALSR